MSGFRQCSSAEIHRRPLVSDGGIALLQDGFAIFVKAAPGESEQLSEQFAIDGIGRELPKNMVRRARFTIAHEIAHTFFYDVQATPPKPKVELKSARSVQSLERVCNSVAGTLLLPEAVLKAQFSDIDLTQPAELSRLADSALISKQALVRRLQEIQQFPLPTAIIACVSLRDEKWVIDCIFRHYSLRQILIRAKEGAPLSSLVDHLDFLPNAGEFPEVDAEIIGPAGPLKLRFQCDERFRPNNRGSFFVVAKPVSLE